MTSIHYDADYIDTESIAAILKSALQLTAAQYHSPRLAPPCGIR